MTKKKMMIICIIILIIVGGIVFYISTTTNNKDNDIKTEETEKEPEKEPENDSTSEEEKEETVVVPEEMSSEQVEQLVNKYDYNLVSTTENETLYNNSVKASDFNKEQIDILVLKYLDKLTQGSVSLNEYQNALTALFGAEFSNSFQPSDIYVAGSLYLKYEAASQMFVYSSPAGIGGMNTSSLVRQIGDVRYTSDGVEIDVGLVRCDVVFASDGTGNSVCKAYGTENLVQGLNTVSGNHPTEFNYADMTKYTYKFKYDQNTGYYLISIDKK